MTITLEKFFEKQVQDYFQKFEPRGYARKLATIAAKKIGKDYAKCGDEILSAKTWKRIHKKAAELIAKDEKEFLEQKINRIEEEAYTLKKFGFLENYYPDAVRKQAEKFVAKHYSVAKYY